MSAIDQLTGCDIRREQLLEKDPDYLLGLAIDTAQAASKLLVALDRMYGNYQLSPNVQKARVDLCEHLLTTYPLKPDPGDVVIKDATEQQIRDASEQPTRFMER